MLGTGIVELPSRVAEARARLMPATDLSRAVR